MKVKKLILSIIISILSIFSFVGTNKNVLNAVTVVDTPIMATAAINHEINLSGNITSTYDIDSINKNSYHVFNVNFCSCNISISGNLFSYSATGTSETQYDPTFNFYVSGSCLVRVDGIIFSQVAYLADSISLTLEEDSEITFISNNAVFPSSILSKMTVNNAIDNHGHTKVSSFVDQTTVGLEYIDHSHGPNSSVFETIDEVSPTWDTAGVKEYYSCSSCYEERYEEYFLYDEELDDYEYLIDEDDLVIPACCDYCTHIDAKDVTCFADGNLEYYKCSDCGRIYDTNHQETTLAAVTIGSTGHNWGGYHEAEDSTCCQHGMKGYYYCSECSSYYFAESSSIEPPAFVPAADLITDDDFADESIYENTNYFYPLLDHNYEEIIAKEATCEENGIVSCYKCNTCDKYFVYEDDTYVEKSLSELVTVAFGHSYVYHKAVSPTCDSSGNIEYYTCSHNCGKYFVYEDSTYKEATLAEITIPALGHSFTTIAEDVATCMHTGHHTQYYCEHCHLYYENNDVNQEISNGHSEIITYTDSNNHTGNNHIEGRVNPTTTSEGYSGDTYCECGAFISNGHVIPKIVISDDEDDNEEVKEELKENIESLLEENVSEETKELIDDALNKVDVNQALVISESITKEFNELNDLFEGKSAMEKVEVQEGVKLTKQEATEIVTSAITQAVLISSSEEQTSSKVEEIASSLPSDSNINISDTIGDFYQRVMNEILYGNPNASTKQSSKRHNADNNASNSIDYSVSKETYEKALYFYNTSVDNMLDASLKVRVCSGESLIEEVNIYISGVSIKSFKDFDKEAADEEFYNMAYKAILISLQESTLTNLTNAYNEAKVNKTGTALQELTDTYNNECEAVRKLHLLDGTSDDDCDGCFEDMIFEVMRQKYITLINQKYENNELTSEEYNVCLAYTTDAGSFEVEYKRIFRNWCLQLEDTSKVQISLEELSNAVIDNSVNKVTAKKEIRSDLTTNEIILFVSFSVCLISLLVFLYLFNKKKGVN